MHDFHEHAKEQDHKHEHTHTHSHSHTHPHDHEHPHDHTQPHEHGLDDSGKQNKVYALLTYMLDHNIHHAEELQELVAKLNSDHHEKAAEILKESVACFQQGNEKLQLVLNELKEA